jgi:glutamate synthase (NADPH/NADH) large chain
VSALALVHQRFSTNTFPTWDLAHPFRMIAHNGEINTVRGNVNWFKAREQAISSPILGDDLKKVWPLHYPGQSDSASFDNALELLVMGGYSLAQAVMLMIPEAWEKHTLMDEKRRAFYEYHAAMMEPWDGPAAVAFTDGRQIGATLDRNGLRPARYLVTDDDLVVMASESGVLPIEDKRIVKKWRLQPGKMFLIDMEAGPHHRRQELKDSLANAKPYREWIEKIRIKLDEVPVVEEACEPSRRRAPARSPAGLRLHAGRHQVHPRTDGRQNGEEATGSMGNDAALPVLSSKNKPLYNYFKQLFAQVTNPPIDPIREELVMSVVSFIGPKPNLLEHTDINPPIRLEVAQPVLSSPTWRRSAISRNTPAASSARRNWTSATRSPGARTALKPVWPRCAAEAEDAVRSGANILIVSDRKLDAEHVAIPALLATSAIHQHLVKKGLRTSAGLVVETGSAREVHHFALLGGYGAEAVHPYLALETLAIAGRAMPKRPRSTSRTSSRPSARA